MVRRRNKASRGADPTPRTAKVVGIGARGDGIAQDETVGRFYVPFVLPGERVRLRPGPKRGDGHAGEVLEILEPSPLRAEPPCPHFGACGGCALQHMDEAAYARFTVERTAEALARRGLEAAVVAEPVMIPAGRRRRAAWAVHRTRAAVALGFNAAYSRRVVDISDCVLLVRELRGLIAPLRRVLADLTGPGDGGDVVVNLTDSGADVVFALPGGLDRARLETIAGFAADADLARASWQEPGGAGDPEPVVVRRTPVQEFAGVPVALPAGAFLQPSAEGEAAIVAEVRAGAAGAARLADLFCGCGTLSLPLAADGAAVRAVDGIETQTAALAAAAGRAGLGGRLAAETRDLDRRPMAAAELKGLDAVVLDPPRAGAHTQCAALAESAVERVVYVSCNPAALGRDARVLVDAGYRLERLAPIDQFPYSAHLELVATFARR